MSLGLAYILFVRGNSEDIDDTEYYVEHMLFAVLRESDQLLYYRSMPKHDAVRELRYDGTVIKNKYIGQTGDRNVLTRHL